jgi:hypothetical protein
MIQASELRVGNIVLDAKYNITKVKTLNENGINYENGHLLYNLHYKNLIGLELNIDNLPKLGFEIDGDNKFDKNRTDWMPPKHILDKEWQLSKDGINYEKKPEYKPYVLLNDNFSINGCVADGFRLYQRQSTINVYPYTKVHEIQNIWYLLTMEELPFDVI